MKSKLVLILLFLPIFLLGGCHEKTFNYQNLQRDIYNTGGNLTFVYEEVSHTAIFGGEGEVVQYYTADIAKGWTEEGCRVGIQILVPNGVKDFKSGTAILGEEKLDAEEFYIETTEGNINYALFQPLVDQEKSQIELKITWQEGFKQQTYKIVIKEGTTFMEKF